MLNKYLIADAIKFQTWLKENPPTKEQIDYAIASQVAGSMSLSGTPTTPEEVLEAIKDGMG